MTATKLHIACLCAAWCKTCDAYRAVFAEVARRHPQHKFVWIDIEDHGDVLGETLDINDFPTLAVWRGDAAWCFFGPALPHAATLERLLAAAQSGTLQMAVLPPALSAVETALRSLHARLSAG